MDKPVERAVEEWFLGSRAMDSKGFGQSLFFVVLYIHECFGADGSFQGYHYFTKRSDGLKGEIKTIGSKPLVDMRRFAMRYAVGQDERPLYRDEWDFCRRDTPAIHTRLVLGALERATRDHAVAFEDRILKLAEQAIREFEEATPGSRA